MDGLFEVRHLELWNVGKGERCDVEERLRGIVGTERLHDDLVDGDAKTVGNAFWEEGKDLVD